MFGKKAKKEEVKEEPTPVMEAKVTKEREVELNQIRFVVEDFQKNYMGIIGEKDLEKLDPDVLSLNLLFAIYGELKLLRGEK